MNSKLRYEIGANSRTGNRRNNQDRYLCTRSGDTLLLCLGDGMGGHPRGEDAASILIEQSKQLLDRATQPIIDPERFLERVLRQSHLEIRRFGQRQTPPIDPRTTVVVTLIQDGTAYWAHAGDSRLYLFRDGAVISRTRDHSYVERLRRHGIISDQQKQTHPQRNFVTRCLGGSSTLPKMEQGHCRLRPDDVLMLCSDGLWSSIDLRSMGEALCTGLPLDQATHTLTEKAATAASPESDNVTIIALRVHSSTCSGSGVTSAALPAVDLQTAIAELQAAIESFEAEKQQEKT